MRLLAAVLLIGSMIPGWARAEPFSLARFQADLRAEPVADKKARPQKAQPKPKPAPPVAKKVDGDPHEAINRKVFAFNAYVVQNMVEPTAWALDVGLPELVKQAGRNVYSNLIEPEFFVTNLMVGDNGAAGVSAARFGINSTVGILGIWDPARHMGLERKEVEFTEGLCATGVKPGDFIVLPLIGPTSANSAGLLAGFFAVEWFLLAQISPVIATADLVIDLSASAASLRYARDVPDGESKDPYAIQRADYKAYLDHGCPAKPQIAARLSQTVESR